MNAPNNRLQDVAGLLARLQTPADDADQLATQEIGRRMRAGESVYVLDVDDPDGLTALRLAKAGAHVVATDASLDNGLLDEAARTLELGHRVTVLPMDLAESRNWPELPNAPFDLVTCHHAISRLPFSEGRALLRRLLQQTRIGGRILVSAFGLHSDLGDHYPAAEDPVRDRFAPLDRAYAAQIDLHDPLCLYSERELFLLLFDAGASVLKTYTTTHGNVRAVAVRV